MTPIAPLIEAFLARDTRPPAGRQSAHARLLCLELPAALHVRRRATEGLAIGADAGADSTPASSAPSWSISRTSAKTRR